MVGDILQYNRDTEEIDYDFSEIESDIKDVIQIIETCDCDCEEFGNLKICGRCQAILKLKDALSERGEQ